MQNSYHTLVGIAMELVSALESAVAGNVVRKLLSFRPNSLISWCIYSKGSGLAVYLAGEGALCHVLPHTHPFT